MLTVGDRFPHFRLKAVVASAAERAFREVAHDSHPGKWLVVFFWPKDFTFVCPTEIAEFGRLERDFAERGAQLLGVSTDDEYVHLAWRRSHPDLRDLPFPMLADLRRELAGALGILDRAEGCRQRRAAGRQTRPRACRAAAWVWMPRAAATIPWCSLRAGMGGSMN